MGRARSIELQLERVVVAPRPVARLEQPELGSSDGLSLIGFLFSTGLGGVGFIGFVVFLHRHERRRCSGAALASTGTPAAAGGRLAARRIRPLLERIRAHDPNFSIVLLEDFLYALYAKRTRCAEAERLERLSRT